MRPMRRSVIHVLFFVSGACGLVYEVAWVRQFGLLFGNTVQSASAVTAVFMAGLGFGALAAGFWADRRRDGALRAYGLAELVVAALGATLAFALPASTAWSAGLSTYVTDAAGWHSLSVGSHLARVGMAALMLGPSAMLMGATLTLLARHEVDAPEEAGRRVGLLYGVNTAGAALGALSADLLLVPGLGLLGTQLLAVAGNICAGFVALGLAWGKAGKPTNRSEIQDRSQFIGWNVRVGVALALAGTSAMGLEIAWFRFLAGVLGPYRAVFAVLLAVVLVAMGIGSALAGRVPREHARSAFAISQAVVVVGALWAIASHDPEQVLIRQWSVIEDFLVAGPLGRAWLLHWVNGVTIAGLVLVPALAMGAAFPLGNALAHDDGEAIGRRTGQLYLATTVGNVVGALGAGFVLLPLIGIQLTVLVFAMMALAAPVALLQKPVRVQGIAVAAGVAALVWFSTLPADHLLWRTFPANRARDEPILEIREGLEQIMVVTGSVEGPARLWTSGHPMTSTTPHAQRYMRLLAHAPLLCHPDPNRVLVIAYGAGNTTHAASLHPSVRELDVVDLSRDVLELSEWFAHANKNVLDDPRVSVFVNDGRHHLLMKPDARYDLVVLEPPPLAAAGVSSLYAREFYELAKSRMADDGVIGQWLPAYQVPEHHVRSIVRAFVAVFPDAVLLVGSGRELALIGGVGGITLDPAAVDARLRAAPDVAEDLRGIGLGSLVELGATFAADGPTLERATAGFPPVSDDMPILDHSQASHLMTTTLPSDLFAVQTLPSWCPECSGAELDRILDVTGALYRTEAFLRFSSVGPDPTSVLPPPDLRNETLDVIVESAGLRRVLMAPDALALRAKELWDEGRRVEAREHLDAAREQAPGVDLLEDLAAEWAAAP